MQYLSLPQKSSMMVQIHTLSVADFKHTMRNNDLYDSTIESMPELAVISIGNSFDDFDPDDIFSNGPSSRWFTRRHRNVLNMTFDDITSPEKWELLSRFGNSRSQMASPAATSVCRSAGQESVPSCDSVHDRPAVSSASEGRVSETKDYVLFDQNMARELAFFVDANHEARTWIVHCSAGISRSGAVSRWLKDWLKFRYGIDAVNVDGKYAIPNSHVLAELNRMFY